MIINKLLNEKNISKYRLAKLSGISRTTICDICSGRVSIKNCTGETLYKLAQVFEVSMESLLRDALEPRPSFETFKSNICHYVKDMGDINFLIDIIETGKIYEYIKKQWYKEALYLLAMVDYLCNENELPLLEDYEELRSMKLSEIIYPVSILVLSMALNSEEPKEKSLQEAIPEFLRHNIVESEVRNVA